jgi:hypothetical protein
MRHGTSSSPTPASAGEKAPLQWPPPGLERLYGAVWPVNTLFGLGGALMVLPMLLALSTREPFWSPGPLGSAWWLPAIASLCGLLALIAGLARASRIGFAASRAAESGYDLRTIADVACDATRDAGFVMQGLRQYGNLEPRARRRLLDARIVAAFACGAALLWIPVAFTAGLLLAARRFVPGIAPLWPVVLVPAGALLGIGLLARGIDETVTRYTRRAWLRRGTGNAHSLLEATEWLRIRAIRFRSERMPANPGMARLSAFGLGALALALPVPVILLALLSAAGPMIERTSTPRTAWGPTMSGRIARTEILRPYALPADPSISPTDAGESLQVLEYVGRPTDTRAPVEREPVRAIAERWVPAGAPVSLFRAARLAQRVYEDHQPLTVEEREWLERMVANPGHAEFARLARAGSADIIATRWNTDRFGDTNAWELPIYRYGQLRDGSYAHIALGLLAADQGDLETAETRFREVISTGLLLVRDGPSLIDMLIGSLLAQEGAHALRLFYEATGRDADADGLRIALEAVDRAETAARSLQPRTTGSLQGLVSIAGNTDLPPGIRWESLRTARLTAECQTASAVLPGQDTSYDEWLRKVNGSLVRFPADQALFDLLGSDRVPADGLKRSARLIRGLYRLTFGTAAPASSCAGLATAIAAVF